ncbi:hypothetical protein VE25_06265 [Devosia geojensis]|uniref:DUF11 domain-containing protein n=2 Tax=Devosia geojensis TaxID=443610 RepID=A0A0F5FWJ4_9HYPH|nr:hypothetical protein VE25_06265 [Devosia geojensis]
MYTQTWATYQNTFTAAGTEATIQFVNNTAPGPANTGLFIDNFTFASTQPCTDLSITKTDGATTFTRGSNVTYTIVVRNDGTVNAPGATVSDPLPTGITAANWTCGSATGGATCGAASGTGAINTTANLPAGSSLTYSLTLTVPAGYSGVNLTNTATVAVPAGFIDPNTSNNTASDTNTVSPPQPSFGACTSTIYLGVDTPTQLVRADTSTNPFTFPPIGAPDSPGYNAMGYDLASNYIYATRWDATTSRYRLLRIGGDGSVRDLGGITGGGINSSPGIASGVIGADGFYYLKDNGASNVMWRVDLTTLTASSIPLNSTIANADLAWHNGLIYTHDHTSGVFYSINPSSGVITPIGQSGITPDAFGSLISASNGVFGRLNSGGFYRFDIATGVATLISDAPAGAGDGAKCPTTALELPVDLRITKSDGVTVYTPGTDVTYTIMVSNNGPFGVQNALVNDALPAGITGATWTCGTSTGGGVCVVPSGTGAITNAPVNLPAGASVTFQLTMSVPTNFAGDLVNTATVASPSGSPDTNLANNTATDTNVPAAPALTVDKTGTLNDLDGDGLIDPGETVSYSFLVRNSGNVTMTGVTVNDPLLANAGISVTPGPQTLSPGGTATFTATYTPTQAQIDAGQVSNTATGTGTPPAGPPIESPPDTVVVPPDQAPGLAIDKTGTLNDLDGDGLIDLGETITYTFLARNTGSVTLTNVTVNDPLLANAGISVTPGPQTLGPGGTATFTATYTPTQTDIDTGEVSNTATGTGTPPSGPPIESPPDTVVVPPEQTPGLVIDKTGTLNDGDGDGLIDLGETISYAFLVTNTGTVTLTNVTVNDPLVAVDQGPQTLAPGASFTFTATYTPTQAEIDAGQVSNTATGSGTDPDGNTTLSPPDTVVVPPDQTPGLTIDKTGTLNDLDGDGLIDLGETITYSFLARNTGTVTLTGVTINDPLLDNAGIAVTPGPQTLAPGGSVTFTATYTPTQAEIDAGQVENTATGSGTDPDGNTTQSPPDTVVVPPDQTPGLTIDKTGTLNDLDGDGLIDLGETITYSFLARNTGTVTLTNVTVNDPLLANAGIAMTPGPQTLAPRGTATFTATYTPTQAEIDAGQVENTATGTGTPPSGPPIESPPDTVVVPPDQTMGLTIDKTGTLNDFDGDGLIDLGETITYTFLASNTGAVTLTNVTVNDPLLANAGIAVTPGPQTLAPGGSATFTATYTPTQADIDAGRVENTATGTGTPPSGPPITSPPDTVVVPPDQASGLTIVKTGTLNDLDGDGFIDLGETIGYSFLVTNTGAVTLTNVTVNDPLLSNAGISVTPGPQTLAPGANVTFTAIYTPTQADIDAGQVENTATGTGTPPSGPPITSPPDTVVVPPDQTAGLSIEKTGTLNDLDGDGLLDPGETISYSFLAINTGAVTLTDVTIDDPLLVAAGVSVTPGPQTLAPGANVTFTAVYAPTQAQIDAGVVENIATGTGTPPSGPPIESPPDSVTVPPQPASLNLVKTGSFDDVDGNGAASVGDTLTYTFTVTNDGGQTAADVWPKDPGPTFGGQPATGTLSTFTPGPVTLSAGQQAVFTATYTLTEADVANAAGAPDSVANTARAVGFVNGNVITGTPVESEESRSLVTLPVAVSDISVSKVALLRHIRRGEEAPFAITVTNNSASAAQGLTVVDTLPSGFRYVDGSASVNGVAATPVVEGRQVIFSNVAVPANSAVEIRLRMLALSSAGPGEHVNRASVTDASGNPLAPDATASVDILAEPVFDCGDVIGKVFDDRNRNSYQDEGEPGLPGVRIATVDGWLITTDAHGRFHVPCAMLPDQRIGSNFIMKLDTRTLPTGYRVTTENPRVVRLTAGKMTELNFGASIGRVVRLDLQDAAFLPGELELRPEWVLGLDQLMAVLAQEQSVLRLTYIEAGADPEFAEERLKHLRDLIGERWRQTSGQYRLEVEMRVETGQ